MRVLALLFVLSLFHAKGPVRPGDSPIRVIQTDPLIVYLEEQKNLAFHLYNVRGGAVLHWEEKEAGPGMVKPDCPWEAMEEGIYYLKILSPEDSTVAKVVIR